MFQAGCGIMKTNIFPICGDGHEPAFCRQYFRTNAQTERTTDTAASPPITPAPPVQPSPANCPRTSGSTATTASSTSPTRSHTAAGSSTAHNTGAAFTATDHAVSTDAAAHFARAARATTANATAIAATTTQPAGMRLCPTIRQRLQIRHRPCKTGCAGFVFGIKKTQSKST